MNELRKIRGANEAALLRMRGRLDLLRNSLADAKRLAGHVDAFWGSPLRDALGLVGGDATMLLAELNAALEPAPWCDGCGDGATGVTARISTTPGGSIKCEDAPCPKCHPQEEGFA